MRRLVAALLVAAAAGCGSSDTGKEPSHRPVSKEELRALLDDVGLEIGVAFHRVDEATERGNIEQLRRALLDAVEAEQRQTHRLDGVLAPAAARDPLARLIRATRQQATDIERLANRKDLTAEIVERDTLREDRSDKEIDRALVDLDERGFGSPSRP